MASLTALAVATILVFRRTEWRIVWLASGAVLAAGVFFDEVPWLGWVLWLSLTLLFGVPQVRVAMLSTPLKRWARGQLPELSQTEREALQAGAVGLEADLLSGNPQWARYFALTTKLSPEEQAFLDGPADTVCGMVDDWQVTHELADLPQPVWDYLKRQGFFGLVISKEHGGKGFSAIAHSEILVKLYSASTTLGVTVAVPNSLGPGELLHRYGTDEQKHHYLPRLASGEEIPCFALTSPDAGSDASAILDEGIVCRREIDGESILGISISFDKRYITLAPVATLIGLAFKLKDPDALLGSEPDIGVTCALIPRDAAGVDIGRRHFPLNVPFQNGPMCGSDVFIPMSAVIGGQERVGQGWQMLVESLSAGRGISLPSGSTGAAKIATLSSGAYSRIRHQFGIPIAEMEGVKDSIARQVANTVIMDATRRLVAAEIDEGRASGIAAAIVKYHVTERGRQVLLDAMDVHGGKAIMLGPSNYLAQAYQSSPIAITVEGANIMTRSLMIFGQGAIRCHPYLLDEMAALQADGVDDFDRLLTQHAGWTVRNITRAFWLAVWCGTAGRWFPDRSYATDLDRFSSALATLTDIAVMVLGGSLKRRQSLSARLGDLLSHQYLAAAVFTDTIYDYRTPEYSLARAYIMESLLLESDRALQQIVRNFPNRIVGGLLSIMLRPMARTYAGPGDRETHALADLVTVPTGFRDNLGRGAFTSLDRGAPLGRLEQAMRDTLAAEPIIARIRKELGASRQFRRLGELAERGREAGVIDEAEYEALQRAAAGRLAAISVDDFDPDELPRTPCADVASGAEDDGAL